VQGFDKLSPNGYRFPHMRVISGAWRGRPLVAPAGLATRPTSDRAREGLFSMLASRIGSFEGLAVADLFAGSGSLGLEALSRGAAHCLFVDTDPAAVAALKRNVETLGTAARADVRAQAAEHASPPPRPCDLVMMDPPYRSGLAAQALAHIANERWLAPGAWISVEIGGEEMAVPEGLTLEAERRYGKAQILILRHGR
jgi:16S rRNA (guanine966-N2)-methyltransferase